MSTGTGWPFGGPWVPLEESALKAVFIDTVFTGKKIAGLDLSAPEKDRPFCRLSKVLAYCERHPDGHALDITDKVSNGILIWEDATKAAKECCPKNYRGGHPWRIIAVWERYGVMKVKRAGPGGEGFVIDHFDKRAVKNYLRHIEEAFERTKTPYPHTFFNDSYEVSEGTWTPSLFEEFASRRGYRLEDALPRLIEGDAQVVADYRETLGDLLLENFTKEWTAWAHSHGAITRNQAHGSPANLIDCYAAVDIPEIEGFGLSELGIKGLRRDPGKTRKNDSDFSMLKYAPSAAHIMGKPFTSSETFTWLTEHFRTSLSQLKPDIDLMFAAGVNHMFFHGTCFSPKDEPWPGWKFYASIDMSPTNSIWRDASYFMEYVERCQSFLQWGEPDNDFLVYLPVRDMWQKRPEKLLMQFSIHQMGELAPEFIQDILAIDKAGFDCDYISDRLLMEVTSSEGMLLTSAGTSYKGLVIPDCNFMPENVKEHIKELEKQGACIIRSTRAEDLSKAACAEKMKSEDGLKAIRRKNPTGFHYFIANLTPNDIHAFKPLSVKFSSAAWFNPLTGEILPAHTQGDSILISLRSGESMIMQTWTSPVSAPATIHEQVITAVQDTIQLSEPWHLAFMDEAPIVSEEFDLDTPKTWETLSDNAAVTMGTGIYTTKVNLNAKEAKRHWLIDLGDVRESARVFINGKMIGCAWAVPFILDCRDELHAGWNDIRIEVTNLPANRIAEMDRRGLKRSEELIFGVLSLAVL